LQIAGVLAARLRWRKDDLLLAHDKTLLTRTNREKTSRMVDGA
jgi:hypothetical protein